MAARAGSASHCTRDRINTDISGEGAQFAEILEGLGIALADDLRHRVVVEHPDQLPGVAVSCTCCVICCSIVIADKIADPVLVGKQLVIVVIRGVFRNNAFHIHLRIADHGAVGGIETHRHITCLNIIIAVQVLIFIKSRTVEIFLGNRQNDLISFSFHDHRIACSTHLLITLFQISASFVEPVERIRAVCQQCADYRAHITYKLLFGRFKSIIKIIYAQLREGILRL